MNLSEKWHNNSDIPLTSRPTQGGKKGILIYISPKCKENNYTIFLTFEKTYHIPNWRTFLQFDQNFFLKMS